MSGTARTVPPATTSLTARKRGSIDKIAVTAKLDQLVSLPTSNAFHPLSRNGQPTGVAEAVLFLASDAAARITAAVLPVDGGVKAGRN